MLSRHAKQAKADQTYTEMLQHPAAGKPQGCMPVHAPYTGAKPAWLSPGHVLDSCPIAVNTCPHSEYTFTFGGSIACRHRHQQQQLRLSQHVAYRSDLAQAKAKAPTLYGQLAMYQ
jgi:hypothetical protein